MEDIQRSRQLVNKYERALSDLIVAADGRQVFEEFARARRVCDKAQDEYLATVKEGHLVQRFHYSVQVTSTEVQALSTMATDISKVLDS